MNYFVAICLLGLSASTLSSEVGPGLGANLVYAPGHASADYYSYPKYAFDYAVKDPHTGDNKAQWEKRDGDVVKGAYSLVEPDGSLRVVEYQADDKTGFNAIVKRIGPNLHPIYKQEPIYKAPIPVLGGIEYGPISVGPVAGLGRLASAPLISGPWKGGASSSVSIIKDEIPIRAVEPVLVEPLYRPIIKEPLLRPIEPIYRPYPVLSSPIVKQLPYIPSLPIYKSPLALSYSEGIVREPIRSLAWEGGRGLNRERGYEGSYYSRYN